MASNAYCHNVKIVWSFKIDCIVASKYSLVTPTTNPYVEFSLHHFSVRIR